MRNPDVTTLDVKEVKNNIHLKEWRQQKKLLSDLEKLVSNEFRLYKKQKVYRVDSLVEFIAEKAVPIAPYITLLAPSNLELYKYPYKQPQTQQLIFATKKNQPIILSIIQKNDLLRQDVDLTQVSWLDRFESMQVLKILLSNPENVQTNDCKIHHGQYPFYNGVDIGSY